MLTNQQRQTSRPLLNVIVLSLFDNIGKHLSAEKAANFSPRKCFEQRVVFLNILRGGGSLLCIQQGNV
jgi:hypothetical protein